MGAPPNPQKWTTGKINAVPCPYPDCRKPNDFRENAELLFDGYTGDAATKSDMKFKCDHCEREMQIVRIERTALISLRQA